MSKINGLIGFCQSYGSYKPVNGISNIGIILKDIEDILSHDTGIVDMFHDSFFCHQGNFQVIKIRFKITVDGPKKTKFELMCMNTFPPFFPLSHPIFSIFKPADKKIHPIPQLIQHLLPDSSFEIKIPSAQCWHQTFNFRQMLMEFYSIISKIFPFYENSKGPVLNPPQFYETNHNFFAPSIQSSSIMNQSNNPHKYWISSQPRSQASPQPQWIRDSLSQQTYLINQRVKEIVPQNLETLQFSTFLRSQLSDVKRFIGQIDLLTSSIEMETERLNSVIEQFRQKDLIDHFIVNKDKEVKLKLKAKQFALIKVGEKNIKFYENKNRTFGFNLDSIGRLSDAMKTLWEQEFDCILANKIHNRIIS